MSSASLFVASVVTATTVAWITTGDPLLALLPLLGVLAVWAALRAPAHWIGVALLFVMVVLDNPQEHPAQGAWRSPLYPLGLAFFQNLNTLTGVSSLRFAVVDLVLAGALVAVALRRSSRRPGLLRLPRPLSAALALVLVALLGFEVLGALRQGDMAISLWQLRQLVWLPGLAWLFAATIRGPQDLGAIFAAVVLAALIKVAAGAYFYWVICLPRGVVPEYVNTHSDTVLFTTAIVGAAALLLEPRSGRVTAGLLAVIALVGVGVVLNGRRLAYVGLAGSVAAMVLLLPKGPLRARLARTALWAWAPILVYLRLGWHSSAAVFGPASKIASLFSDSDRSAGTRDIENYNLLIAWKQHPLLGTGFGFAYDERSKGDSIEDIFALYRYIAHNSVLWLFSVGGLIGFAAIWSLCVVGAYLGARAHRLATAATERAAALVSLCVVVSFIVQAYGDMGMQSWIGVSLLAMALVVAGKLAVSSGAWPAPPARPFAGGRV